MSYDDITLMPSESNISVDFIAFTTPNSDYNAKNELEYPEGKYFNGRTKKNLIKFVNPL